MSSVTAQQESVGKRPPSVGRMFLDRVAATPDREAYRRPVDGPAGATVWQSMSWAEAGDRVQELAAGLVALGIDPEQRVAAADNDGAGHTFELRR